ncbi:MAG: hypothetical protein G3M78_14065 [Candidatus Nitrohelix vancouverensis]|uniref:Uncharacterized protein n=1 Tax=Candidatus Nitrohelix vancouverensis TaxID=2705534 RepID=A0A7T0C4M5_9BACT|nr:MAG: hypothetical protein G3M78_14065 [Candidatus Nitrohelix vancouverensis]
MAIILEAQFKNKLNSKLYKFDPRNTSVEYHKEIFSELFKFPQFKAHVAAYIERNYCVVLNDEDHPDPVSTLKILKPEETRRLNEWIINRNRRAHVIQSDRPAKKS